MRPLLNADELLANTGVNYKTNLDVFKAALQSVTWTSVEACINPVMLAAIQNETAGAEVLDYWNDYIKPWLSHELKVFLIKNNNVSLTNAGTRTAITQTSSQTPDLPLNAYQVEAEKVANSLRERMLNYYSQQSYVFDGIAYPPVPRMKSIYNNAWTGYSYYFGPSGWNWYNGAGIMLGDVNSKVVNSANLQIIGFGNGYDY